MRLVLLLLALPLWAQAMEYRVDCADPKFHSLASVNALVLQPGDRILFRAGCRWRGTLRPQGSGTESASIVIGRFGNGAPPAIDGAGAEAALFLRNSEYYDISDLEITNDAPDADFRRGVLIRAENLGRALRHIHLTGLDIHNVKGKLGADMASKCTGGIGVEAITAEKPTRFEDVLIENNHIHAVDNMGIYLNTDAGPHPRDAHWEALRHTKVVVRNNRLEDIGKNAICIRASLDPLIERNVIRKAAARYHGNAIYVFGCKNALIQLNEVSHTNYLDLEGAAFDSDYNSEGTVIQYNYSHDNGGGLADVCNNPVSKPPRGYNDGTIIRYNVSRNEGYRVIAFDGPATNTRIYNNTLVIPPGTRPHIIEFDLFGKASLMFRAASGCLCGAAICSAMLNKYYTGEGTGHQIQIVIPNGQYAPLFVRREEAEALVEPSEASPLELQPLVEKSRSGRWKWFLALVPVVVVVIWAVLHGRTNPAKPTPVVPPAVDAEIRIAAGKTTESYIDTAGRLWLPDRYFTGGAVFHRPAIQIQRTYDPDLFQNGREGQFSYSIPLRPGTYELHLYLAETGVASDTLRTINFAINGQPASAVDVASDAGGINTATMKVLTNITPAKDGFLHLAFVGSSPNFLNAIELVPAISNNMRPFRMTARDSIFRDHLGQFWLPEQWASGGQKSARPVLVGGTSDVGLYQWKRFGHFSYMIPVQQGGFYTLTLHFSEAWFAPTNSIGGIGSRVFDVYCNGTTLLKNFDILQEAGGMSNLAVIRVFHHVAASPLGKIELTFVPVANYALINAIEVTSE